MCMSIQKPDITGKIQKSSENPNQQPTKNQNNNNIEIYPKWGPGFYI